MPAKTAGGVPGTTLTLTTTTDGAAGAENTKVPVAVWPLAITPVIGDDAEAITEFLTEFRKSVVHHAASMETGVTSRDVAQVAHTAHTLKSTARAAGATALGDALAELEAAAKRHDLEAIDRYYEEFQRLRPLVMESLDLLVPVR